MGSTPATVSAGEEHVTGDPSGRLLGQLNWAVIDQAVSSGTNFVLALLIVRTVSAEAFGEFSIVVLLYILAIGAARALVTEPVMLGADRYRREPRPVDRAAVDLALGLGGCLAVLGLAAAAVVRGSLGAALVVFAVCAPLLLVQDTARGLFVARRQPKRAAVNDIVWAILQFAALAVVLRDDAPAVWLCVAAWLVSGSLAGVVALFQLRVAPTGRRAADHLRANRHLAAPFIGNYALTTCPQYLVFALAPLVSSMRDLGLARAAFVPFGALGIMLQSAMLVLMPASAGLGFDRLRTLARRASLGLGLIAVVAGAVVLATPDSIGRAVVGDEWDATRPSQIVYGLLLLTQGLAVGPIVAVRALGGTGTIVRIRLLALPIVLGLGLVLPWQLGAPGIVGAVLAGEAITAAGVWLALSARARAGEDRDAVVPEAAPDDAAHAPNGTLAHVTR